MNFFKIIFIFSILVFSALLNAQTIEGYIDDSTPDSRYIDHGDGTVTDTVTGLMWAKCPAGNFDVTTCTTGGGSSFLWINALVYAEQFSLAGYADWRLPDIKELNSLSAYNRSNPAINTNVFPRTSADSYWSSSPAVTDNFRSALSLDFGIGRTFRTTRTSSLGVRLVRGGE